MTIVTEKISCKAHNLTCEIINQLSIIACEYFKMLERTVLCIISRNIHGCSEISDVFLVLSTPVLFSIENLFNEELHPSITCKVFMPNIPRCLISKFRRQ